MEEDNRSEDLLEIDETKHAGRFRRLNARWPWLKFALFLLIGLAVLSGGFYLLHQSHEPEEQTVIGQYSSLGLKPPATVDPRDFTGKKLVALTFDDGPSPATTPRLLDILAEKNVHVTFFVVGNLADQNVAILKREKAEGHEVGSHSTGHQNLARLSVGDLKANSDAMQAIFQRHLGQNVELVRPPYGSISQTVYDVVPQPLIIWTVDPLDWKYKDSKRVHDEVLSGTFDGAIVLMHDIHPTTVDAVASIIDDLRAMGYEFLTVSELARVRGVALQRGMKYGSFRP